MLERTIDGHSVKVTVPRIKCCHIRSQHEHYGKYKKNKLRLMSSYEYILLNVLGTDLG